jgi:hypothetical protein
MLEAKMDIFLKGKRKRTFQGYAEHVGFSEDRIWEEKRQEGKRAKGQEGISSQKICTDTYILKGRVSKLITHVSSLMSLNS